MATVEDALELLTDPAYKATGNRAGASLVRMRATEILNELIARSASDEVEARRLATEALRKLRGQNRSRWHQGGLRPGGPRPRWMDDFWVPASALRH